MYVVDHIGGDIHGGLEAEGGIGAVNVVIDGLGQGDHVHAGVRDQLGALLGAVAAHDHQAVQVQAVVGVLHGGDEAVAVLINNVLAGDIALAGSAQNGAALGQDAGKVLGRHEFIVALDQAPVAVIHAEDFHIIQLLIQGLAHAPDGSVETLAIAAAGDQGDADHSLHCVTSCNILSLSDIMPLC